MRTSELTEYKTDDDVHAIKMIPSSSDRISRPQQFPDRAGSVASCGVLCFLYFVMQKHRVTMFLLAISNLCLLFRP